ncbi:MAG TPA: type I-E CRISPR-associated protein Cse2/CasB [Abditibacteriaceae bacterium]
MNSAFWESQLNEAQQFVQRLHALREARSGELALLRRNAGETVSTSRNVLSVFYKLQPPRGQHSEKYFLVATLFDLNRIHPIGGDFGETMQKVKANASDSFERRFLVLLDAGFSSTSDAFNGYSTGGGELAYRLRQMTKLAASKDAGINWPVLLADLCWWDNANKPVQKKWASNFYDFQPAAENTIQTNPESGE